MQADAARVALVTGAGSGIGRAVARALAAEGWTLALMGRREAPLRETLADALLLPADVADEAQVDAAFATLAQRFGRLDLLFNNAGIMHSDDDTSERTSEATWDLTMNINLKGVFLGCKYGIPALRRAGGGSVINTASFVAHLGAATPQVAYTASKGGVLAFTRELAVIHARENIRVNALCPGPLRTELLMKFLNTEEKKQRRLVHIPMGRFGEAREMAQQRERIQARRGSSSLGFDMRG